MKEDSKMNQQNKISLNLDLISGGNHQMNRGAISKNYNWENPKLRLKFNQITILKKN